MQAPISVQAGLPSGEILGQPDESILQLAPSGRRAYIAAGMHLEPTPGPMIQGWNYAIQPISIARAVTVLSEAAQQDMLTPPMDDELKSKMGALASKIVLAENGIRETNPDQADERAAAVILENRNEAMTMVRVALDRSYTR